MADQLDVGGFSLNLGSPINHMLAFPKCINMCERIFSRQSNVYLLMFVLLYALGPGKKSAKQNGQKSLQKNTISSWIKKNDKPQNGNSNGKIDESVDDNKQSKAANSEKSENGKVVTEEIKQQEIKEVSQIKSEPESEKCQEVSENIGGEVEQTVENTEGLSEDESENPTKKIKKEDSEDDESAKVNSTSVGTEKGGRVIPAKCDVCRQLLTDPDLRIYPGHPHDAVEEYIALTDPKLSLFTGDEGDINEHDERPQNKVTQFSIYDKAGHLCPFDGGLIERNVLLYFSGYIKAIYEENPEAEGGIPVKDMGPINEWWVSGYDGGERALIGFSTAYGEYYLMEPCEAYAPLMESVKEKIYMGKLVIEFLLEEENASYEDLLNKLQTTVPPFGTTTLTEDSLLRHAQFVCDQVLSFDTGADNTDDLLITSPCMRALVKLAGVTFGQRRAMRRSEKKDFKKKKLAGWSKATTTPLVSDVFETFFSDQLDSDASSKGPKRRRCGVCEACQLSDCGTCPSCVDMIKFGGTGRSKQACVKRRCPNMAIQEADDDDQEEDDDNMEISADDCSNMSWNSNPRKFRVRSDKKSMEWVGEPLKDDGRKIYF
ncbi:DNA (cytosine-5)-methyltransferase 1, partial [Homalodisca vitripennis]